MVHPLQLFFSSDDLYHPYFIHLAQLTCTAFPIISDSNPRRAGTRVPLFVSGTQETEVVTSAIVVGTGVGHLRLSQWMDHLHIHWEEEIINKLVKSSGVHGEWWERGRRERERVISHNLSLIQFLLHTSVYVRFSLIKLTKPSVSLNKRSSSGVKLLENFLVV